jgi:NitT/TauT family transport system permease protein
VKPPRRRWYGAVSALAFFGVWQVAAALLESDLLPGPVAVAGVIVRQTATGELPYNLTITLARVAASFVVAMAIGTAIGVVMGRSGLVDRLFDFWILIFLNMPALVVIILAYVWMGLVEAAVVVAVAINKIPNVAVTLREGARALDRDYQEMAQSFALGRRARLFHVVLPQVYPFIAASARTGLALIWKIVLVAELLGQSNGVGFQLNLYFQLFDIAGILAYAFSFILVIQAVEVFLLQPIERRVNRWRR